VIPAWKFLAVFAFGAMALQPPAAFADAKPRSVRDCPDCPELVVLRTGTYLMGADAAEGRTHGLPPRLAAREQPRHPVTVARTIAFGRYEITLDEFAAFANAAGYSPEPGCWEFKGSEWVFDKSRHWKDARLGQGGRDPVTCVSWHDAEAYVLWLSRVTGKPYRLPSEAEWEYAARGGSQGAYWFGSDSADVCRYVNLGDQDTEARFRWAGRPTSLELAWVPEPCHDGFATTSPVDAKPPNAFGVYGVLGNVMEWVADCWHDDYRDAPHDQDARLTSGDCASRVMRGQGWAAIAASARSAFRRKMTATDRRVTFGIRVVRDLAERE
jgi:formylglycine-generating enzyme